MGIAIGILVIVIIGIGVLKLLEHAVDPEEAIGKRSFYIRWGLAVLFGGLALALLKWGMDAIIHAEDPCAQHYCSPWTYHPAPPPIQFPHNFPQRGS